jgi:4-hydroxy-tetrahydrodipicolinate reductase
MKIAYVGLGKMGSAVREIASDRGHQTVSEIDKETVINAETLRDSDLVFECTVPSDCPKNIKKICHAGRDLVVITTGWYEHLPEIRGLVEKSGIRFLYASNFSVGVHLYFKILQVASRMINAVEEYDIWAHELHHKNKVDSPSGTAKTIEEILLQNIGRKTDVVENALQRKIKDHEIHFSSTRGGLVNFEHTVGFDSEADVITIRHAARNRNGYALGAVKAAEWLSQKKPGFYTMEDVLTDWFYCDKTDLK